MHNSLRSLYHDNHCYQDYVLVRYQHYQGTGFVLLHSPISALTGVYKV